MKILNLYACLGGNRYKWGDEHEITAVELDEDLAKLYQERFPNDTVILADAHNYLLEHFKEFEFIWTSPPCPTHSKMTLCKSNRKMKYPDMNLYEEIILLNKFYKGKYCVENVIPFYEPLIPAKKRGRHLYWTNFNLPNNLSRRKSPEMVGKGSIERFSKFHDFDFYKYKGKQHRGKIARNLVDYEAGKTILDTAIGIIQKQDIKQTELF